MMKRRFWKNGLLLLLLAALLCAMGVYAWAAEELPAGGDMVKMPALETSADSFNMLALDGNGNPALKEGNYVNWIDRLDLTDADYALTFYQWLEDNCYTVLADPTQHPQLESGEYAYLAATIQGTGYFTYTGNKETDGQAALNAVYGQIAQNETAAFGYITAAYSAFDRDHPEVFWLSGKSQVMDMIGYSYYTSGKVTFTQYIYFVLQTEDFDLRADAYQDTAALSAAISERDNAVAQIVSQAQGSSYDMVQSFNRWLTTHNCYNSNISGADNDVYECISALTGSVGIHGPVCEGYARALKVLCDEMNIPCVLVDGKARTGAGGSEAHMWNYVQMDDGNWYAVDVTWNDPTVSGITSAVSGYEDEDYLLVGSETVIGSLPFIQSHPVSNTVTTNGTAFTNGPVLSAAAYTPAAVVVPEIKAKSFSLSFEDEILVNFYYTVSDLTDVTEHGMLVFYSEPDTVRFESADEVYRDGSYDEVKARYAVTTTGIPAKKMGETRYYVGYAALSDGTYAYSTAYDYSPKKYSMNMLGKDSTSAKQKSLCVAMLNYGAAAQTYFGYKTDALMNSELTQEQQALVISYDSSLFKGSVAAEGGKIGSFANTGSGFSKKSVTVSFEGAFCINYYFTPNQAVTGEMTLYCWTPEDYASAQVLTAENASDVVAMTDAGDGRYWAQVNGIAAKALDKTYYVAAVYTDAEGNTHCTGVIAYSLSKYCINNAKEGNAMQELAANTAMYGYYAAEYFR